ncbi:rod-binding protein [Desulfopila inferna]|mgnify:CR=1 FL=1|uniref:rod-binding protein n=1 Tax=Desulfopila inferna TaxID=468528 RepID=UPI00196437C0|nr:rod-binding protein [Desulfopila inferna]MBM9602998.1 rod-binding protein [Desulfopila inferna]
MNLQIDPRITQSVTPTSPSVAPDKAKNDKQLRQSAREFEAIYINEMYKAMRKNIPEGGLLEKSSATTMFEEMLDMEMARKTAAGKGMGIGEAMYDQLKGNIK